MPVPYTFAPFGPVVPSAHYQTHLLCFWPSNVPLIPIRSRYQHDCTDVFMWILIFLNQEDKAFYHIMTDLQMKSIRTFPHSWLQAHFSVDVVLYHTWTAHALPWVSAKQPVWHKESFIVKICIQLCQRDHEL